MSLMHPGPHESDAAPRFATSYPGSFAIIVIAAAIVVCAGIKLAEPVLVPVILGAFVATVNVPQVMWLHKKQAPVTLAVGLALIGDAIMLGGFSSLLVGSAAQLSSRLPAYLLRLQNTEAGISAVLRDFGVNATLPEVLDPRSAMSFLASMLGELASMLSDLVLALIIAAFLLFRFAKLTREGGTSLLEKNTKLKKAVDEMYRYIAIKTGTSIATGILVGLWLWAIGADLPVLFGLLAFLLNYIPTLGSIIAGLFAVGTGLLQYGFGHASLVAVGYLVVNISIGNILEPRIMGRALGLWPLVVLLSVVLWGFLLGLLGAVLSALLTQGVKVLLLSARDLRPIGLALGPRPVHPVSRESQRDLLEEAMPQTIRPGAPDPAP